LYEIYRGNSATGIRGIIDPFDKLNPYRIQDLSDLDEKIAKSVKNMSWVTTTTADTTQKNMSSANISLNLSKISIDSNNHMNEL
tara:strand:- start:402 stop:653 length:252 start_codon:yes stop_codon:yes gene_type:complete